jgi:hypothetical protein
MEDAPPATPQELSGDAMTGIADQIRDEVLAARLKRNSVLVVYDKERRYRDLCRSLASDATAFVDASESSIESREAAAHAFFSLREAGSGQSGPAELLIYIPAGAPLTDEGRQADPFAAYAAAGAVFPDGDGDDYLSLCLKAKPDHSTEIRRLFEQDPSPSFALIDNVGAGGLKWPMLRTALTAGTLKVETARDILFALLLPSPEQKNALSAGDSWVDDARALLADALGLKLVTRGKTWESIAGELWRFLLFSEFAFDLPGELPSALANVPRAPTPARPLVEDLCERLRSDARTRPHYIERAGEIEKELCLPGHCEGLTDLRAHDTFPFEERVVLVAAVRAFESDKLDDIRAILDRHRGSVWTGKGESQEQWELLEAALHLAESCEDAQRQIDDNARNLDALVGWYVSSLCQIDRRQREFEQARANLVSSDDAMSGAVEHARARYRKLAAKTGALFTRHFETTGWPPPGLLANADVFDRIIQPMLNESGRRAACILVDALRYELGVALHAQLAETEQAALQPACAQLPTVTPVGMASLLPGAGNSLRLVREDDGFAVMLGDHRLTQLGQRMDVLRTSFGDRFAEMKLSDFLNAKKNSVPETVNLLVLRSTEIDAHLESNPETTLSLIHQTLKSIRVAIHKLKGQDKDKDKIRGFDDVVVVTDHGFFLNAHAEAGDLCAKPPGNWVSVHDRSLLGEGAGDANNFAIAADKVGIRGDFPRFAGPRSMTAYRRGLSYFHGGASLQEAVVPVLTVRLRQAKTAEAPKTKVVLSYKDGAKRITTRLPVVSMQVQTEDLFALQADVEILLEAHDSKGNVVGEAKPGGPVNAATGTITLKTGESVQVTVRMNPDYEGKFKLKALNPETLGAYATLDLETGYL